MAEATTFTTPVGRLVWGSISQGRTKDNDGVPYVVKNGPNAGQPITRFDFGLAILKTPGKPWQHEAWGALIVRVATAAWPQGQWQAPTFAWKVTDGDSAVPNKAGRKPCDREGYPGHWVLAFSSSYAPSVYEVGPHGPVLHPTPAAVKTGYYVEVAGNVAGNGAVQSPGVYLNHSMVAFRGFGPEIVSGPDVASAGFGASPLPAGASAMPAAAMAAPPQTPYAPPVAVPPPGVAPNPAWVAGAAAPPPPVAAPPPAPVRRMTPLATATYEAYAAMGWTDPLLVQHGLMVA